MSRLSRFFIAQDEAANVLLGEDEGIPAAGNPHYTISQRLGQMLIKGTPLQRAIAKPCDKILTWIENTFFGGNTKSHCLDSIKDFPQDLPTDG